MTRTGLHKNADTKWRVGQTVYPGSLGRGPYTYWYAYPPIDYTSDVDDRERFKTWREAFDYASHQATVIKVNEDFADWAYHNWDRVVDLLNLYGSFKHMMDAVPEPRAEWRSKDGTLWYTTTDQIDGKTNFWEVNEFDGMQFRGYSHEEVEKYHGLTTKVGKP